MFALEKGRDQTKDSAMSDKKLCPECGAEIPAGAPSELLGLTMQHCAVTLSGAKATSATNAAPLTFK